MQIFTALVSGLLLGLGLIVSGMANPAKVIGFLDLTGSWDPSLAFVMGGAIAVGMTVFAFARRRQLSLLGNTMPSPPPKRLEPRLIWGGITFGIGWGLAGFCPGPALASLAAGDSKPWLFVGAMMTGMIIFEFVETRRKR
jgi:uncharacterized membrane protein YedE/YeeE